MPIGSTNISMNAIAQEKQATQLPAAAENISLKGLSVDGVNDFQFVGGAFTDIAGTPDGNAPYGMSEFNGFSGFSWGTPGTPSGSNVSKIFNMSQEDRNDDDTCVVCSFNMTLNTSTKIIAVSIVGSDGGGGFSQAFTISPAFQVTYTGTLTSLEARFVHSGELIQCTNASGDDPGKVLELFSSTTSISKNDINNNTIIGSNVTSSNNISSGASGTFRSLRTNTGNMAVALAATSDDVGSNGASLGRIAYSGSDSIKIQLRANGSSTVDLFTRTGSFTMESQTTEEDTS